MYDFEFSLVVGQGLVALCIIAGVIDTIVLIIQSIRKKRERKAAERRRNKRLYGYYNDKK